VAAVIDSADGVVEAIDNALTDWEMSPDAMRWSPDGDAVDERLPRFSLASGMIYVPDEQFQRDIEAMRRDIEAMRRQVMLIAHFGAQLQPRPFTTICDVT
jgi:hypothetical protein